MGNTPASAARNQKQIQKKLQEGTIISFTTVRHPPAGFPVGPRIVGLIELQDGSRVMGQLIGAAPAIGQQVHPRMRLMRVNEEGLRIYDVAYEVAVSVPSILEKEFPGYILALTGPSGVGKSTVGNLMAHAISEYVERVPIVTTRKAKPGDDGEYEYVTKAMFTRLQRRGDIVAATQIPSQSEKRLYGYRERDIKKIWKAGKIPVVITEQGLLQELAGHYGRRSILSLGLLPPGKSRRTMLSHLLHRLRSRGRDAEEQIKDRMKNAEADLDFFEQRSELFDHLLVNENLETVLETIKGHVLKTENA